MYNIFNLDRFEVYFVENFASFKTVREVFEFRWIRSTLPGSRIIRGILVLPRPCVPALRKISPWTRFESTMLPASWVPTRSYPLQLPRSKLRGPTPTHRSIQLIPFGVETRTKSDPLHTYFKRGPGGTLEPSLRVVWDRAFSSSLARLSTSLLNLRNGVNRVSRGASQAVSRDPDVALAEFLEYSSRANSATLMSRIYLIYLSTRSQCCTRIRHSLLLLSPVYIYISVNLVPVYFGEKCLR